MVGRGGGHLLKVATVACAVLAVGEVAARWRADDLPAPLLWSSPEMAVKEAQIAALEARGGASVVFLGSSTVDVAVDPSLLDLPSSDRPAYNAATGAASLAMIDVWARHVVVPRLDPDVVVVGVVSRELNPNDPEQARIEGDFVESKAVRRLTGDESVPERVERRVSAWSRLVEYRTVLRRPALLLGIGDDDPAYGRVVAPDGQYEDFKDRAYRYGPRVADVFRDRALRDFEIGAAQGQQLSGLLDLLTDTGASVVLVNMPVTEDYVRLHPGGQAQYDRYRIVLQSLADRSGVRFVDVGVWPSGLFADPVHLNGAGAARLTERLGVELGTSTASNGAPFRTGSR